MDQQSVFHPMTDLRRYGHGELGPPRIISHAEGVHIVDTEGNRLLDGFGGLYSVSVGYGRTEIADAIAKQAHALSFYHLYAANSNEPAIRLADKLTSIAPGKMQKVFFGLSGSDANETQVKICWYVNNVLCRTEKKKIIARDRAYHGASIMAGSLTGVPVFHKAFDLPVDRVLRTTAPHHYWGAESGMSELEFSSKCASDLEQLIQEEGADSIAAFIAEPMMGSGGIVPPPKGYWEAIQPVLQHHDILLIADEVVCGFGRLGSDFGCFHYDITPDLITCAKGLTSSYLPLSAVLVGPRVWDILEQGSQKYGAFAHGYTYSGHPVCAAAGLASIEIIQRENLKQNAADMGEYILSRLHEELDAHSLVGEIRGEGLLFAIEFVKDRDRKERFDPALAIGARASAACLAEGLIARAMPGGDILGYAPPLVISKAESESLVTKTCTAIESLTRKLRQEGVI
jgi:L-2,4-diaminobutyrate transaminase